MRIGERIEHNGITAELVEGQFCVKCVFITVTTDCPRDKNGKLQCLNPVRAIFKKARNKRNKVKPDQPQIRKEEDNG